MKISHLLRETLKGRTLGRAIQNNALSEITLAGKGIDLGAGTNSGCYYEFLKLAPGTEIQYTDLIPPNDAVVKVDLEKKLPFPDNSHDFIILNNVLEAIYNYQLCIDECYRILKNGGDIVGVVPFFHRLHPDPDDFFRYTKSSLTRIFSDAGFQKVYVRPLGYGPFSSCANTLATILKFRIVIFCVYALSIFIDDLLMRLVKLFSKGNRIRGESWSPSYTPIYYLFHCTK